MEIAPNTVIPPVSTEISGPVIITGASGGLGIALVEHFFPISPLVIAIDRAPPPVRRGGVLYASFDLATQNGIALAATLIGENVDSIELLVNAAGVFLADDQGSSEDVFDSLIRNNLMSSVLLTLRLESLLAAGNTPLVVNISSTDAIISSNGQHCEIGTRHDVLYAISKGGLITATKALAMKWAEKGIRVFALCPTIFSSPMTSDLLCNEGKLAELQSQIPMRRLCKVEDICSATHCCYQMKMTTAHVLPIDGGYLCI